MEYAYGIGRAGAMYEYSNHRDYAGQSNGILCRTLTNTHFYR